MKNLILILCLSVCALRFASAKDAPTGMIKAEDLQRAKENLRSHEWARQYLDALRKRVTPWKDKISSEFLEGFIPETTPGSVFATPCPSCRAQGKPYLSHGDWDWSALRPEELRCKPCGAVFPNEKFPESVVLQTTWGKPQTLTFAGGDPFPVFSYAQGHPSFSGNIRAQKVRWISSLARDFAETYALTGDVEYAKRTRDILLRFAEVYPFWLVHVSYGEYADLEPGAAAKAITALPRESERVVPPNRPDGKLHTGFWSAGRAGADGLEGLFVNKMVVAYDLTVGAERPDGQPVYSAEDRARIEKDLLREGTKLLVADTVINNKSMANRSAAGLVGLALKDPELVRFGVEGFSQTVDEWFLPDGATPESPAYALMALSGIVDFGQALRGYTDPPGYQDAQGKRYDTFDPYRDTAYAKVWDAMFRSLQGDLRYPPFADSYATSGIGRAYAELMADNYPENPDYLALLHAALEGDWNKPYAPYAIYYADPDRATRPVGVLKLPSTLFPNLKLGFLRTGTDGRESLLLLSASDWGIHHHKDGLNLTYWKNGKELWSDLGYLWDHPDQQKTVRTLAHNTVLLDGKDQIDAKRRGEVRFFLDTEHVKAMRAASNAYPDAKTYERTSLLIDHGNGRSYVVDVFEVEGGATQDYVYHGPNADWSLLQPVPETPPPAKPADGLWEKIKAFFVSKPEAQKPPVAPTLAKSATSGLYDLTNVQEVTNPERVRSGFQWKMSDTRTFSIWHLPLESESVFIGEGWGQRDSKNADRGKTLPYVVRRTQGEGRKVFVSVLEEHPTGKPFIRDIAFLTPEGASAPVTALQITTEEGRDYVVVNPGSGDVTISTPDGQLQTTASLAVLSAKDGQVRFHAVTDGKVHLRAKK